ncbi:hypothetical protein AADB85_22940, partial [Escherichia coli]|uniref:hypothetical protein n=11 Tax=Gammaproteobacteria TaxID=1236 RepID=UPI0039871224
MRIFLLWSWQYFCDYGKTNHILITVGNHQQEYHWFFDTESFLSEAGHIYGLINTFVKTHFCVFLSNNPLEIMPRDYKVQDHSLANHSRPTPWGLNLLQFTVAGVSNAHQPATLPHTSCPLWNVAVLGE